ncbi:hypothetical protein [Agrobacterium pusense]|uniref:hypothetical protein n=1 Tax=Agrobacterium pusense TaxID=648995 RepID=UPI000D19EE36|nr:hypothetical protein [Agrobacterium pusense]
MSVEAIKKALEGVTQEEAIDFINTAMRNWNRLPKLDADDLRDLAEELQRFSERRYASTLESLQRENEALKKDRDFWKEQFQVETRYRIELADRGTLLALTDANSRAEAAEAEVKRLKSERLYILGFNDGWEAAVGEPPEDSQALASTGGEHHAD